MPLRVVGAGLPRTGTHSLKLALERLLGGPCCHMSALPGHPFNLGDRWDAAIAGRPTDWNVLMNGFVAAVDWPASACWRELSEAFPEALVLLSTRQDARTWYESVEATIMPYARMSMQPDGSEGRSLIDLFERFTGVTTWDDPATLMAAHDRHNAEVRATIPGDRLLDWRASDGWSPICRALGLSEPDEPFPWVNRREEWRR